MLLEPSYRKKSNKPFGQPNTCPINEETMAHRGDVPCSGAKIWHVARLELKDRPASFKSMYKGEGECSDREVPYIQSKILCRGGTAETHVDGKSEDEAR